MFFLWILKHKSSQVTFIIDLAYFRICEGSLQYIFEWIFQKMFFN